ncbi:histidine phosphatase family protein [Phyllobacterium sp. LjRoot231]|uniref:histidine phosphatase family protein n=1 Tax=Phyllobacterium sp. LjRoot231 TaxID=3342289 RepID=UPI003ECD87A7
MLKQFRPWAISVFALLLSVLFAVPHAYATDAAWARVQRGGYTILIQGADSSGTLSPSLDNSVDCSATQTLSDRGRQLAQKLGARFAARSVRIDKILTSSTCNARETARLSFNSIPAEIFKPLDPLPADEAAKRSQIEQIRATIAAFRGPGNLVMMADRANIIALTGITPRPTEAVVVSKAEEGETIHIAGRIIFD